MKVYCCEEEKDIYLEFFLNDSDFLAKKSGFD